MTFTELSDAVTSAFCAREPYDPVNSLVRMPVTPVRQQNLRAGIRQRDVPFVAGHIPVQFVVILKKFQAVADAVMQVNGAHHVGGIIDVDFPFQVVALVRGFDFQRLPAGVGGALPNSRRASS